MAIRLNKAQREAVEHDLGPLLVLAGAGSGKTGVVTKRIATLLERGASPRSILALTFTNKAAAEMQERVARLVGAKRAKGLFIGTFHRFGLEVLSRETKALGLRGRQFAIFDRADQTGVVRDALRAVSSGKSYDLGAILNRISLAKNAFVDPEGYAAVTAGRSDEYDTVTADIYPRYQSALRSLQAFDFDDLVCEPVQLWRRRPDVLASWRMRFRYLVVDEYQDTNTAQLEMLRALAAEHRNLCVVGDDDQAIYAWRGADVRNILEFERHYPGTKVVRLEKNYRSTAAVLDVANAVLASSHAKRHPKKLVPTVTTPEGGGHKVVRVTAADGEAEAGFVAAEAHRLIDGGRVRPKDIAVLYRSNLQAGEIEAALRARGVPYRMLGATQAFERKEVKDVLAYLAVAADPGASELGLRRSLNYPPRGVGDVALGRLATHATAYDKSLWQVVQQAHAVAELGAAALDGCRAYVRVVTQVQQRVDAGDPLADVLRGLCEGLGLKAQLWAESGQNNKAAARRWNNILFLHKAFERRDEHLRGVARRPEPREALGQFLRLLVLREEGEGDAEPEDKVTLLTMHGAKGLEWRHVFLVGLEEGLLPHARTIEERTTDALRLDGQEIDEVEQERRLFYVAVTRAREQLYLCHAAARPARGKLLKRAPSRFLLAIPDELLEHRTLDAPPPPDAAALHRGASDVLAAILGASGPL